MLNLLGMPVVISKPHLRYQLPADVPPPTGMTREQFDMWSRRVCGFTPPIVPDWQVYSVAGTLYMTEATWRGVQRALEADDAQQVQGQGT